MNKLKIGNLKELESTFKDTPPAILSLYKKMPFDLQIAISAGCEYVVEKNGNKMGIRTKNPIWVDVLPEMIVVREKISPDKIKLYKLKVDVSEAVINNLKKTMSGKQQKKLRQLFNKTMRSEVREKVKSLYSDLFGECVPVKKKPKYIPNFLWRKLVKLVVNQDFINKYYSIK